MALNLSTLTNASTSATVLAEAQTTADFLDSVPILKNIARGSNKGGDAKQTTALNQPKALPLIDGNGYLYLSNAAANYASIPDSSDLDITGDITFECDFIVPEFPLSATRTLLAKYNTSTNIRSYTMVLDTSGNVSITLSQDGTFNPNFLRSKNFSSVLSSKTRATVKVTWRQSDGRTQFFIKESDGSFTQVSNDVTLAATSIYNSNEEFEIGSRNSGQSNFGSSLGVFGARIYASVDGTDKRLDVDFTATNIPHGAKKFKCATGQTVTINQSGNDPATVIKKSVLRFNGSTSSLQGLFANNIDGGHMFAAFSVLGDGGQTYARIFSVQNSTEGIDYSAKGISFSLRDQSTNNLASYYGPNFNIKNDLFDDDNGDILHEVRILNNQNSSKTNNTAALTDSRDTSSVDSDTFNICRSSFSSENRSAIDLEYLALFPALSTDEAARVVNYINTRNNVFDLKDSLGYYFYDGAKSPAAAISSGSASWNGRIVGSDNGDADKLATQSTSSAQPVGDGYKVTFADNTDFLTIPSTTQAGWQICGTSLGTFAYKVNANAVTELNLLGNLGNATYRKAGDLYGVILLPETATGADIEAARKLLIDRGAADVASVVDLSSAWRVRRDIVEFKVIDMSTVTQLSATWINCSSLTSFDMPLPSVTSASYAWNSCTSLSSFGEIDISSCANFTSAWQGCTALTSFPAGAKLGTAAENVNFTNAWQQSGLTSFSTTLPTAGDTRFAWKECTSLTSFSSELPSATNVSQSWYGCSSLSDFSTTDIKNCTNFTSAWQGCSALTSFPSDALLGTAAENVNFTAAFNGCTALTELPAGLDMSQGSLFTSAFQGCTSLATIGTGVLLGTNSSAVRFDACWMSCSGLTSFPDIDLSKGRYYYAAWFNNTNLVEFPPLFTNWNPSVITSGVFNLTWDGCAALTAQSVENILVSINASGKHATTTGASGGNALVDAGIDIDYNTVGGTSPLSAATNTAIASLQGKGWSIVINGTTL